jgi:predicted DNA-binding protein
MDMERDMRQMTKKTTILFPPKIYKHLVQVAKRQNRSVGDLVRDAVEIQYGEGGVRARLHAVDALLRVNASIGEPSALEEEIKQGALER